MDMPWFVGVGVELWYSTTSSKPPGKAVWALGHTSQLIILLILQDKGTEHVLHTTHLSLVKSAGVW